MKTYKKPAIRQIQIRHSVSVMLTLSGGNEATSADNNYILSNGRRPSIWDNYDE